MLYVLNVLKKEQILGPNSLPEARLQCLYLWIKNVPSGLISVFPNVSAVLLVGSKYSKNRRKRSRSCLTRSHRRFLTKHKSGNNGPVSGSGSPCYHDNHAAKFPTSN